LPRTAAALLRRLDEAQPPQPCGSSLLIDSGQGQEERGPVAKPRFPALAANSVNRRSFWNANHFLHASPAGNGATTIFPSFADVSKLALHKEVTVQVDDTPPHTVPVENGTVIALNDVQFGALVPWDLSNRVRQVFATAKHVPPRHGITNTVVMKLGPDVIAAT
jgi:hypothetical protein